jgi:hypothetical protein
MNKNRPPVDYAREEGLDATFRPDQAQHITIEPESKGSIWPWALAIAIGIGFSAGYWLQFAQTARTVDDLRLAERQAVEKMETALDFTRLIKPDTIQAAQALYACRGGKPSVFVCEATKLEAERRELPIVFDPTFEDTKAAQDLAWKGVK